MVQRCATPQSRSVHVPPWLQMADCQHIVFQQGSSCYAHALGIGFVHTSSNCQHLGIGAQQWDANVVWTWERTTSRCTELLAGAATRPCMLMLMVAGAGLRTLRGLASFKGITSDSLASTPSSSEDGRGSGLTASTSYAASEADSGLTDDTAMGSGGLGMIAHAGHRHGSQVPKQSYAGPCQKHLTSPVGRCRCTTHARAMIS